MRHKTYLSFIVLPLLMIVIWQSGSSCQHRKKQHGAPKIKMNKLQPGMWGGAHLGMDIIENGARLDYDCANGTIDEPIILDQDGKFDVKGLLVKEHGGPIRIGEQTDGEPARYTGQVRGDTLTLTVVLTKTNETIGTFTLTRGKAARLTKCM